MDNTTEKKSIISNVKDKISLTSIENIIWKNNLRKVIFVSISSAVILFLVFRSISSSFFISSNPYIEDFGWFSSINNTAEIILYIGEENIQNTNYNEALFGSDSIYYLPEDVKGNNIKFPGLLKFTNDFKLKKSKFADIANYHIGVCYYRLAETSDDLNKQFEYYSEAIKFLEKETKSDQFNSFKNSQIGDILVQSGKLDEALKYYQRSLESDENEIFKSEILFKTAETAIILEKFDLALEYYKTIKNDYPESQYSINSDKIIAELTIKTKK